MATRQISKLSTNGVFDRDEASPSNENADLKQTTDSIPGSPFRKPLRADSWMVKDKLSREFKTADDQDELGNLIGDAGEKLLALVDDIRKIDKLGIQELDIPQLVVVGDTSSGKSSVLQALTRLPFPVARRLCTRFVTETTIRRCTSSEKPGYTIEVKLDKPGDLPFEPKSYDSNDWKDVYQNLKEDIATVFDMMSPENLPGPGDSKLLRDRLQITVRKPDQAHFSIVDVPGLVSNGTDVKLSEELAIKYIEKKQAILLAVTPALYELINQKILALAKEYNALDRTIGVITKCDGVAKKDADVIFDVLRNRVSSENHLQLGWYAVRNRNSEEIEDETTFEERDKKEVELFGSGVWKEAVTSSSSSKSIDPNVLGIKHLKRTLQQSLFKKVKETFPSLEITMRELKSEYEYQLQLLGDPRDSPPLQRVYLSSIQSGYEREVARSLDGDYRLGLETSHVSRLRYHIKKFNNAFALEIEQNALEYAWQSEDQDTREPEHQDNLGPRAGIFHWINQRWDYHTASEPRPDVPQDLKRKLYVEQTKSWGTRANKYIRKVEEAIKACNNDLFRVACTDNDLRTKIREMLQPLEAKAFENAKAELRNILDDCGYTDSWHPLFMLDLDEFQRIRLARSLPQLSKQGDAKQLVVPGPPLDQQISLYQNFYNNNKKVYEVHDWLLAYWKAAFPRFVDNIIIQVVERHLLGENGPLKLFNRKWIDMLLDSDLAKLAGEDEKTMSDRKALRERLEGLEDALRKADNALR